VPFTVDHQQWRIILAASLEPINHLTSRLRLLLIALVPAVAFVATFGGLWLSRRALKSVDEITVAARSIGIANLSERLRVPDSDDELQRLSETWNDMLARLEEAVTRLSQFTSDASHELRTPLAVIRTTAELAVRRSRSPEGYQAALIQILAESERMTQLVDDLLFLAHCDADSRQMPMANLDLSALIQALCSQVAPLANDRQVQIVTEMRDEEMTILGNDLGLRRLVLALLDNAIKYSKRQGTVTVRLVQVQDRAVLEIKDEGCGIPEAEIPLIFHRFYRTSQTRDGSVNGYGLGLSLAAAIAQRHHTSIEVQSEPGSGSTFRISFPLISRL
jgi:heavy metal sensor kinase